MTPRGGHLCTESFGGIKEREVVNKDSKSWTRDDQSNQKRREELKKKKREREREREREKGSDMGTWENWIGGTYIKTTTRNIRVG
jgi:hypothetical protein